MKTNEKRNNTELYEAAGIVYLNPENADFKPEGDFLSMTIKKTSAHYPVITLHRTFPLEMPYKYISVLDPDNIEIGLIRDIYDFDEVTAELLKCELERRYYICRLTSVTSIKDRRGYSYWEAHSDDVAVSFTLRDTYNSIRSLPDGSVMITDADSNRYTLPAPATLDRRSRRLIETFL